MPSAKCTGAASCGCGIFQSASVPEMAWDSVDSAPLSSKHNVETAGDLVCPRSVSDRARWAVADLVRRRGAATALRGDHAPRRLSAARRAPVPVHHGAGLGGKRGRMAVDRRRIVRKRHRLRQLRAFCHAARLGSFSKAAERLGGEPAGAVDSRAGARVRARGGALRARGLRRQADRGGRGIPRARRAARGGDRGTAGELRRTNRGRGHGAPRARGECRRRGHRAAAVRQALS